MKPEQRTVCTEPRKGHSERKKENIYLVIPTIWDSVVSVDFPGQLVAFGISMELLIEFYFEVGPKYTDIKSVLY